MIKRLLTRRPAILALLLPVALAGCSGGGGSPTSSAAASRAALDVYVTDGFSDAYKQVLATLYKIELTTDGKTYTAVYTSTAGEALDLASLSSTAVLLSSVTVPTGTYTGARITFGDHITLVSNAGVSTSVAVNASAGTDTNGQVAVVINTPNRVEANTNNAVYVDFKLAEFQLIGNTIQPSIGCGPPTTAQQGDQHPANVGGTIASLTATGFTLQGPNGRSLTVALTTTTTLTDGVTGNAITLANGNNVLVQGTYDPTTSTLTATSVVLNDRPRDSRTGGAVASVNSAAGSFVLTVAHADGFQPTGGTITVQTNASTVFQTGMRQSGTLSSVTVGANVIVDGTFDATTQTLTADSVCLQPAPPSGGNPGWPGPGGGPGPSGGGSGGNGGGSGGGTGGGSGGGL